MYKFITRRILGILDMYLYTKDTNEVLINKNTKFKIL